MFMTLIRGDIFPMLPVLKRSFFVKCICLTSHLLCDVNLVALESHIRKSIRHKKRVREKLKIQNFFYNRIWDILKLLHSLKKSQLTWKLLQRFPVRTLRVHTAQKMKFCIKETADLVILTEEILNGKLYFWCSDIVVYHICKFPRRWQIKSRSQVVNHAVVRYAGKSLNSGHLRVLKSLSVIERYPLLGYTLKKIVTFGTKYFVRYSWHVCYLGYWLLGGFTLVTFLDLIFLIFFKVITTVEEQQWRTTVWWPIESSTEFQTIFTIWYNIEISNWNQSWNRFLLFFYFVFHLLYQFIHVLFMEI